MSNVRHAIKLGLFLFAIWLLLSGHYTPLLLVLGILSTLLVVLLAARADFVDRETQLILLKPSVLLYWFWLGREIIKSNIDVARRILDPRMPISPNVFTVRASQKTELGRVTYANSITLVPGTVAMDVEEDVITVHALTQDAAANLRSGEMNRRVCNVEGIFPCSSPSRS
ncbi:MAG: Na+/H+ antiporter subunit E [Gammaproteobacteria bacterium]|nr:Na+/H+ antiporter subunit E [Gammaproteobacteria bacterium]